MGDIAREFLQVKVLRTLEPLSSLSADKLEELANKSQVEELPPGRVIFRQGEKDKRCVYLLSGMIELQVTGNPNPEIVKAKTVEAKYPIAQELPRPSTCRTKANSVLLYIDSDLLEFLMDDRPSGMYEVTEISIDEDPESDWMLRFLQSPAFLRLPTDKIQNLLMKFQEMPVQKGQAIIKQGDNDPWYYIVKEGQCIVSRKPAPAAEEVRLAILGPGDGFGEEALITNGKRNATITMKENGVLMRLGKKEFNDLLVKPLIQQVQHFTMLEKVRAGAAIIDVRTNKEFTENGLKGAQNIPLSMLRIKAKSLNPTREHILYCSDGTQSSAAAFLLAQHGINCFVLAGGLNAQNKPFASTEPELTIDTSPAPSLAITPVRSNSSSTSNANISLTATGEFELHRQQAKTQAERASEAEKNLKSFTSRTNQLRTESDALRNQAQRLAEKTAAADAERKKVEAELQRLQNEAAKQREEMLNTAKLAIAKEKERAAQEAAQLKLEAEEARKRAEEDANRARREAVEIAERQARLEAEFKQAEEQKRLAAQAAEDARRVAKLEAERVKQEAEAIRQRALDEARKLRESLESQRARLAAEETAKRNAALDEARRRADLAVQKATQAAEEAKRQAELEAKSIRRRAAEEAKRQAEIEAETIRRHATEDARRHAEAEAELIRRKAMEDAKKLRAQAEFEAQINIRKQAEEQSRYQQTLESSRIMAIEEAQRQANLDADMIRRQALDDVAQLRAEIESTRRLFENENNHRARSLIDDDDEFIMEEDNHAAEEAAAQAAATARRAQEEAYRRRREDEERRAADEARRVAELARRAIEQEETARRQRLEEEAQRKALEDARHVQELEILRAAEQKQMAEEQARQRAELLKERLKAQTIARTQPDEFLTQTGIGMKLASAKLHVVKDKTVLEGEEDIFIFKAPSERPPSREEAQALIKQAEHAMREQTRKELPSFDIEYADEPAKPQPQTTKDRSGFSASVMTDLGQLAEYNKPAAAAKDEFDFSLEEADADEKPVRLKHSPSSRRRLYALAASVVVMVTVSIVAITRPTYMDANLVASVSAPGATTDPQRGLASMRTTAPANAPTVSHEQDAAAEKAAAETKVRNEAEEEFQQLLAKWRTEHQTASGR